MRLMVQNPPLSGPVSGGWVGSRPGMARRVGCGQTRCGWVWSGVGGRVGRARPGGWAVARRGVAGVGGPWLPRANGGNCDHRGATRRRRAVAVRLMVQNPLLSGPVSGGWAGRRPGVAGRVGCGQTRCGWVWSGVGGRVGRAWPGGWAVECGPTLSPAAGSVGRGCRGRMGGIAALGARHAGDTP